MKLELGSLTGQRPTEKHDVRAWVIDDFPGAFGDWECQVKALELQRTFWEKATILHADAPAMLGVHTLSARVVEWKGRVFARQWVRYDLARPGNSRLLPPPARRVALARDYAQMRAMFLSPPPDFDAVLDTLGEAERRLNDG